MTRVRLTDFEQWDWGCGRSYLSMGNWQGEKGSYRHGIFRHELGLVEIYEQLGPHGYTSLRFHFAGRDYCRQWKTVWGDKTIARLAREMIEEIAS